MVLFAFWEGGDNGKRMVLRQFLLYVALSSLPIKGGTQKCICGGHGN